MSLQKNALCILPILPCRRVKSCVCKGCDLIKMMILYGFIQTFVRHWLCFSFPFFSPSFLPSFFFLSSLPPPSPLPFSPSFFLSYPKCLVGENTLMSTPLWATSFEFSQKFHELHLYCLPPSVQMSTLRNINNALVFS